MRTTLASVPAPSAALLKHLRQNADVSHFFTSNRYIVTQKGRPSHSHANDTVLLVPIHPARSYTTSLTRRATHSSLPPNLSSLPVVPVHSSLFGGLTPSQKPQSAYDQSSWLGDESRSIPRHFFKRLWRHRAQQGDPTPRLPSFLDDTGPSFSRQKTAKPGSELKLRCTEIDEHGNVTTVNGEFKKSELIAKYGLLPRDLRKIDSSLLPHILVRPSAILINLLHLRVLIQHNRVLILDVYGSTDSFAQSQFMYDLCGKLSQKVDSRQAGSLPYEFRALEAVLISVTQGLETEFEGVSEPVVRVLRELEEDIDRDKLRHLLVWSKKLGTFEQKARLVRDAIDDLLEADDDLVAMYQSERAQGKQRDENDHTEVEMLLESYDKVCDEIVQVSGNLVSNIRNTEEIVKAILDANRNALMLLDLKFSIGTLGIGSGAFVASLYGMNLKNFIEESDLGFWGVTGWSFVLAVAVCVYGLKKLRKVQRVSMWGDHRKYGHYGPGGEYYPQPYGLLRGGGRDGSNSSSNGTGDAIKRYDNEQRKQVKERAREQARRSAAARSSGARRASSEAWRKGDGEDSSTGPGAGAGPAPSITT